MHDQENGAQRSSQRSALFFVFPSADYAPRLKQADKMGGRYQQQYVLGP